MGICASCDDAATLAVLPTAKLILPDGRLQEYAGAVCASQVLLQIKKNHFVCNADDMDFDGRVSPLGSGEMLVPDEIYFALPDSMLRRRITPEEMAALAVRASAALVRGGSGAGDVGGGCARKRAAVAPEPALQARRRAGKGRSAGKGGRGRCFVTNLSAIPE